MASTGGKNIYLMYNNIVYKINWDVENLNNELEGKTKPEEKLKENNKDQGQEKINPSSFSKTKHIDGLFPQGHNTNQSLASKSGNKPAPITNSKIKQPYNQ